MYPLPALAAKIGESDAVQGRLGARVAVGREEVGDQDHELAGRERFEEPPLHGLHDQEPEREARGVQGQHDAGEPEHPRPGALEELGRKGFARFQAPLDPLDGKGAEVEHSAEDDDEGDHDRPHERRDRGHEQGEVRHAEDDGVADVAQDLHEEVHEEDHDGGIEGDAEREP